MATNATIKRSRSFGGPLLMVGLFAGCILAAVWANLWKADLRVADVRVSGNSIVTEKEVLSLANISGGQKLYDIDLMAAQRRVTQNAFIKSAAVNREAPNRISITIQERVPIAAVVLGKIQYLDVDGVVLPSVRSENIFDLPVLTGVFQMSEFTAGKRVGKGDVLEALEILATAQQLSDELYRRISEVHIESGKDIILYSAESGVPIVFGRGDAAVKLVKLDGFWKEIVLHKGVQQIGYVDLRFEDQVVVRWNEERKEIHPTKTVAVKVVKPKKS